MPSATTAGRFPTGATRTTSSTSPSSCADRGHSLIRTRLGPAHVAWTDRHGGVSQGPFAEANVARSVDDDPLAVAENRHRLAQRLELGPTGWVWLRQVHGATVVDGAPHVDATEPPEADAAVTDRAGVVLVVQTADCAPLALAADDAVAVVHAGWPGLVAGVIPRAVARLREVGSGPVRARLGPCVHPCCYEFGRADLDSVVAVLGEEVEARTAEGGLALDVPAGVRIALERAGVDDFHDVDVCTVTSPDHFSYRRDGRTGRQALVAWIPTDAAAR